MLQMDKYYRQVEEELLEMGYIVDRLLTNTYEGFMDFNKEIIEKSNRLSDEFYSREDHLQNTCYSLMIRRQPVASDFRELLALLQINSSLKRIVDYTIDMNEIIVELNRESKVLYTDVFTYFHTNTSNMVVESLSAFHLKDEKQAQEVIVRDDAVDFTFDELKGKIIEDILEREVDGKALLDYFMFAKYYERIGDRAVSISKSAIYAITGK